MLVYVGQRRRRWANIEPALVQHIVSVAIKEPSEQHLAASKSDNKYTSKSVLVEI